MTYDYAPYGTPVASMSGARDGPGYTGHVNDPDTGLVYMQARYYDPGIGRFLSIDPIGPAAGDLFNFNRYACTNNNPVVNIDLDGHCAGSHISNGGETCASTGEFTTQAKSVNSLDARGVDKVFTHSSVSKLGEGVRPASSSPVAAAANSKKIGAVPPIFKIPDGRPIFRKSLMKKAVKKIDDFASRQIVKKHLSRR